MSIHELSNKIKGVGKDLNHIFTYIFLILIVGFGSFFLGRLSVTSQNIGISSDNNLTTSKYNSNYQAKYTESKLQSTASSSQEGKYLASKNGKLYYTASCKASNRIKPENRVWFGTESDAIEAGYSKSSSCK